MTAEIISQENKTAKLKITATDEDGGSGLSTDNIYKYCLSTSSEEAKECTWTNYVNGEEFEKWLYGEETAEDCFVVKERMISPIATENEYIEFYGDAA